VVILEILTGRSLGNFNGHGRTPNLLSMVKKCKFETGGIYHFFKKKM
jgi:hypothetical protein